MTIINITQLRIIPWQSRELRALLATLLSALRPGRLKSDRGGGPDSCGSQFLRLVPGSNPGSSVWCPFCPMTLT